MNLNFVFTAENFNYYKMNYTKEIENLSQHFGKDVMDQILESSSIIEFRSEKS